jgi:hypothetical protein
MIQPGIEVTNDNPDMILQHLQKKLSFKQDYKRLSKLNELHGVIITLFFS